MKRYKLIKKYPGSPKLGTEVIYSKAHKIYNYNGGDFYSELPKNQVENLPEFWEEVIEKDYEILSFSQNSNIKDLWTNFGPIPNCWCRNVNGFAVTKGYTLNEILNNPLYSIHSVKRLSDNAIFTIGDKINNSTIINIIIKKDKIYLEI